MDTPLPPVTPGPGQVAGPDCDPALLQAILANLSGEICLPLGLLRGRIGKILLSPPSSITDLERSQAETMLNLCDDLDRMTRECLENSVPRQR